MRLVRVRILTTFDGHRTAAQAIDAARTKESSGRTVLEPDDVCEVAWSDTTARLRFCHGGCLYVGVDSEGRSTWWRLVDNWKAEEIGDSRVRLAYVSANGKLGTVHVWERGRLLHQLIGRTASIVFVNEPGTFVYVSGLPPMLFMPVWMIDENRPLLHWGFAE